MHKNVSWKCINVQLQHVPNEVMPKFKSV